MGDEYKNSGQTGAAAEHADVHDNTFNQTITHINQASVFTPSALHQLPPPPRDFVGREKEMQELLQALGTSGVTISGLQGLGGVGKTALALKLAEQLKPKYYDAQFYLDLKGASPQPLTASEAMAHIIRAYHPTAQLPEEESRLQAIYRSLLENQKALLLMDNAAGRWQIEPLIPPSSCVLLVTSRYRFMINGLVAKNLDALEPKDAEQLLLKIAPRIGKCAEKIAGLCGYLPLALELAASALHKFIMLTPEKYVERLSDATERLELVEASLSLSYDLLSEEMQKHWCVLSVFPTTFDTAAVTSLWGVSEKETLNRLAELIACSLIECNETTQRYRLHDLARVFADTRLSEAERQTAKQAHATYFKGLLAQADEWYLQGSEGVIAGLGLFDKERENIEAGQRWSAALVGKDRAATELSMQYYDAGVYVLLLRLHPREGIGWLEVMLQAARLLKQKQDEGNALGNLGLAYYDLGETRKAIEYYEQVLIIHREIGNRRGEGSVLGNLGTAYRNLGEVDKAIEYYEQQLVITREIGDRRTEGNALGGLGNAYADLGETRKAIEFYEQRIVIAREIGDRCGEGEALSNLGIAYADLDETRKAIEFYEQALLIDCEIGDRRGEGIDLWNSALAYKKLGDRAQAISLAEMALAIYEQIEAPGIAEDRATLNSWKAEESQ